MLTIRLTRKGKKNQPFFRIVVVDKRRSSKGGRSIEELGYLDPLTKRKSLNKERVLHWIKMGAQPSDTIHNLLVSEKIIEGKKIHVARVKAKEGQAAAQTAPAAATPAPAAPAEEKAAPVAEPAAPAQAEPAKEPKPEAPEAKEQPAA